MATNKNTLRVEYCLLAKLKQNVETMSAGLKLSQIRLDLVFGVHDHKTSTVSS